MQQIASQHQQEIFIFTDEKMLGLFLKSMNNDKCRKNQQIRKTNHQFCQNFIKLIFRCEQTTLSCRKIKISCGITYIQLFQILRMIRKKLKMSTRKTKNMTHLDWRKCYNCVNSMPLKFHVQTIICATSLLLKFIVVEHNQKSLLKLQCRKKEVMFNHGLLTRYK